MRVKPLSYNNTKKTSLPKSAGRYALADIMPETATLTDDTGC
jgi:hypothetical protein